jgi:hypothetical protein
VIAVGDIAGLQQSLGQCFAEFRQKETALREQWVSAETKRGGRPTDLLERNTRRYLIDPILAALGWNPADPFEIAEEARGVSADASRLYFDYIGLEPSSGYPTLLVEAKPLDAPPPHSADSPPPSEPSDMASLIASAIDDLKASNATTRVTSQWSKWLTALQSYVVSLSGFARTSFCRAAITTGSWIIVFEDPVPTFTAPNSTRSDTIHCFVGFDTILLNYKRLYSLLHRESLVDTLPLVLRIPDALTVLRPDRIDAWFYGVLVATALTGTSLKRYPTRSVYPAAIAESGGRLFVVFEPDLYDEEPLAIAAATGFSGRLKGLGKSLAARLSRAFGVNELPFRSLSGFPGFAEDRRQDFLMSRLVSPQPRSTAERVASRSSSRRRLVAPWGGSQSSQEFVVAAGPEWFYKLEAPAGDGCDFHVWREAQRKGVAIELPRIERTAFSYTEDGEDCHCAHAHLAPLRQDRCHLAALEAHLCCRACIFWEDCWANDHAQLPCPGQREDQYEAI